MRLTNLIPLALSCVAICATAQPAPAPTTRSLSLRDSVDLALRNNLDLQIERATSDIARAAWEGSYGAFDPNFFIEAAHRYDHMPLYFVADKANPDFSYKADSEIYGTGIKGKLPVTGLNYELSAHAVDFRNVRTDFNLTPEEEARSLGSDISTSHFNYPNGIRRAHETYMEAGIKLTQPLLKNSWIDVERQQIKINKNQMKMSEVTLRGSIMKVITGVQLAYYDLIYARENVRVQEQAVQLATNLLAVTKSLLSQGRVTPLEEKRAESHVETIQSDLLAAQLTFVEQQNVLKQQLTDDFNAWRDTEVIPTDNLIAVPDKNIRDESFLNAMTKRPDILQAKLDAERQGIFLQYHRNQLFPTLDIVGSGGGRSADPSFGHAAGDIGDLSRPYYSIGAIFQIPLGNRGARNSYKASKLAQEASLLKIKKLEQQILAQVDTAAKIMETTYKRVAATRNARIFAEQALDVELKRLQEGVVANFLVMEAQRRLTTARSAEIRALADYNKALAELANAEGINIEKNNIQIEFK